MIKLTENEMERNLRALKINNASQNGIDLSRGALENFALEGNSRPGALPRYIGL